LKERVEAVATETRFSHPEKWSCAAGPSTGDG
jgi:hypothetical protein